VTNTIEYEATNAASARASRHANEVASKAAAEARAAVEAEYVDQGDPYARALNQDKADTAWERAFEQTHTTARERVYPKYLAEEFKARSKNLPPRGDAALVEEGSSNTFGEPLTSRADRRF
jgi:hypothetical protein